MSNFRSQKLLAVDPSLSASGWVLFCLEKAEPLAGGVLSPPGPRESLARRFDILQTAVEALFIQLSLGKGDVLICEGPAPLVLNPQSALKVERVRGIFESVARTFHVQVPGRLNPRTVQSELLGMKGKQLARAVVKQCARETAMRMFGSRLAALTSVESDVKKSKPIPQDLIDAALIGALAVAKVQLGLRSNTPLEDLFASRAALRASNAARTAKVRWSEDDLDKHLRRK